MNCDRIARWYRWLEYAAFGRQLERCRNYFVNETSDASRVLMLGEGDGRFLQAFTMNTHAYIDYVDASAAMLALARRRVTRVGGRTATVRLLQSDVLKTPLPDCAYNLVVTHFFLDCFADPEIDRIVRSVSSVMSADARWLVSEFRQPARGVCKFLAPCLLHIVYLFFRWTTGLRVHSLPAYGSALRSHGFLLERQQTFLKGLLVAQLWRRQRPSASG